MFFPWDTLQGLYCSCLQLLLVWVLLYSVFYLISKKYALLVYEQLTDFWRTSYFIALRNPWVTFLQYSLADLFYSFGLNLSRFAEAQSVLKKTNLTFHVSSVSGGSYLVVNPLCFHSWRHLVIVLYPDNDSPSSLPMMLFFWSNS